MAFDAFLKIDGVMGESRMGEIPLQSFNLAVSNSSSGVTGGKGGGGGRPGSFEDFSFAAVVGSQSPKLFEAAATGRHLGSATLTVTDKIHDKIEQLTITFHQVFISSYKLDEGAISLPEDEGAIKLSEGAVRLGPPMESVSFNFTKVEFQTPTSFGTGDVG